MNLIIENFEIKCFDFKTIEKINKYRFDSVTDQSNYFASVICKYFKVISDNLIYYYNTNTKLWKELSKCEYDSFVYDFYNNSQKQIKSILKKTDNIDDQVEKAIRKLCELFDQKTYLNDIVSRSFSKLKQPQFITMLNDNKEHLPIKNGNKINLKTLEVSPRTYEDYFTYESPVEFMEHTPNADKFFSQIQPKKANRELVRKILGYTLTGDTKARKFFIWYGFGSNGKSKVFKVVEKILGCQYSQLDSKIFIKTKQSSSGATPEIMDLMGKRGGAYSEGETADAIEMNIGCMKRISGEDKISGRQLYCEKVDFYPYIKIHMLTNYTPSLDAQKATKDRLVYIFMDTNFTDNPIQCNDVKTDNDFSEKVENEYLSEMFSWMVKGAKEYYKDCKIEMTEEFKQRTDDILTGSDSITSYFERRLIKTDKYSDFVKRSELFQDYMDFCTKNSQRCQPRSSVFIRLEQKGAIKSTLHGLDGFRGYKIKQDEIEEVEEDENPLDHGLKIEKPDKTKQQLEELQHQLKEKDDLIKQLQLQLQLTQPKKEIKIEDEEPSEEDLERELESILSGEKTKPVDRDIVEELSVDEIDDIANQISLEMKKPKINKSKKNLKFK